MPMQYSAASQGDSPLKVGAHNSSDPLFEPPPELICPITHAVFLEPVLTSAGHAYERAAIQKYLETHSLDPMSNQILLNRSLTPVFPLKSRAREYRESTARACIDHASSPHLRREELHTFSPIDYLRRAVELCQDAGFLPQGLTQEVVDYITSHPSNAYDALALERFAQGLYMDGYRDRAAAVYFYLLSNVEDRSLQAGIFRSCLVCLSRPYTASSSLPSLDVVNGGVDTSMSNEGTGYGSSALAPFDGHILDKLLSFVDRQKSVGWLIDVAGEAQLGQEFVTKLCERILFPPTPPLSRQGSSLTIVAESPSLSGIQLSWNGEKEVLLKYTHVLADSLKRSQDGLERRLRRVEGGKVRLFHGRLHDGRTAAVSHNDRGGNMPLRAIGYVFDEVVCNPLSLIACIAISILGEQNHPLVRTLRAVPLLALAKRSKGTSTVDLQPDEKDKGPAGGENQSAIEPVDK